MATPWSRSSPSQKPAIARLCARYAPYRSVASSISNNGAQNDEYTTWCSNPSKSSARLRSAGSTAPSAACRLRPSAYQVVTQGDQAGALVLGVLPLARVDAVRDHHRLDVRQPVTHRGIDVVAQEARPLHEVAVRVDDAASARVRH